MSETVSSTMSDLERRRAEMSRPWLELALTTDILTADISEAAILERPTADVSMVAGSEPASGLQRRTTRLGTGLLGLQLHGDPEVGGHSRGLSPGSLSAGFLGTGSLETRPLGIGCRGIGSPAISRDLEIGCGRPQILISVEMIQTKRKIPWTRACTLSFTVGWWKESALVIGQVSLDVSSRSRTSHPR
jgi:hypothetical protein